MGGKEGRGRGQAPIGLPMQRVVGDSESEIKKHICQRPVRTWNAN